MTDWSDKYDVEGTVAFIQQRQLKKVALQFPDDLLADATDVYFLLQERVPTDCSLYILGDTSYGSCCVDEVAAAHVQADGIVHYGRACLSPTRRLPVHYVFGKLPLDVDALYQSLRACFASRSDDDDASSRTPVCIFYDAGYFWAIPALRARLAAAAAAGATTDDMFHVTVAERYLSDAPVADESTSPPPMRFGGLTHPRATEPGARFVWLGDECRALTNLRLAFRDAQFWVLGAGGTLIEQPATSNRLLMRRYYLVERVKDAGIVGIVVGTLGVAGYDAAIARLQTLLARAGKHSYVLAVGKLAPTKLGNFSEVDVFVLVACPENALVDSKEYHKPLVTPFEVEMALRNGDWARTPYTTDFARALPDAPDTAPAPDEPRFSFLRGGYQLDGQGALSDDRRLVAAPTAGALLAQRSYRGLEREREAVPAAAVPGRSGIASGYAEEPPGGSS